MKHIQPFESFVNENKQNQIYLDESTESELMYESYVILEEGWLKQAVGYTFFLPLTLINILRQYTLKKIKIKKKANIKSKNLFIFKYFILSNKKIIKHCNTPYRLTLWMDKDSLCLFN